MGKNKINQKTLDILKTIKHDVECLSFDFKKDDSKYHYDLAIGNLKDLIKADGTAVKLIGRLMDVVEEGLPDYYFSSDLIAEIDDYLKS
jgi:hypothetical protein